MQESSRNDKIGEPAGRSRYRIRNSPNSMRKDLRLHYPGHIAKTQSIATAE